MSRRRVSGLRAVPVSEWPEPDRQAWAAATCQGELFEGAGAAAHWSVKNRKVVAKYFGQWISWRNARGISPQDASCLWARPEVLQPFVDYLRPRLAPATVAAMIRNLNTALRILYSDLDRTALKRGLCRLEAVAVPSRDKPSRVRHSRDLHEAGVAWMERSDGDPGLYPRLAAARHRDGLMVALLALRPFRLANLTVIVIGRHLLAVGNGYQLCFLDFETKNHLDIEVPFPEVLIPSLRRYLDQHRPVLLGGETSNRLWISTRGTPMSEQAVYQQVCTVTKTLLGAPINPHLFRDCAATSIAIDDPEHAGIIARILGHKTLKTAERHYIHAGALQASRVQNAIIMEIRSGAGNTKEEDGECVR